MQSEDVAKKRNEIRKDAVRTLFSDVRFVSDGKAHVQCPGVGAHTARDSNSDCTVWFDTVPNVRCFHQSCKSAVEESEQELRSLINEAEEEAGIGWKPTPEELEAIRLRREEREEYASELRGVHIRF